MEDFPTLFGMPVSGLAEGRAPLRKWRTSAALELGADHIRVNSVHPGPIRTPMTDGIDEEIAAAQPIARFGEPDEVARLVLFLLSDESSYSTGAEFVVDGGQVLGPVIESLRDQR